jgi:hypothetical protein
MKYLRIDDLGRVLALLGILFLVATGFEQFSIASAADRPVALREIDEGRESVRYAANEEPGYDLSWWTVDGGGATPNEGSGYSLGGASGQPDAAVWSGDDYVLAGGFWGGVAVEYHIYLPLVLRGT